MAAKQCTSNLLQAPEPTLCTHIHGCMSAAHPWMHVCRMAHGQERVRRAECEALWAVACQRQARLLLFTCLDTSDPIVCIGAPTLLSAFPFRSHLFQNKPPLSIAHCCTCSIPFCMTCCCLL